MSDNRYDEQYNNMYNGLNDYGNQNEFYENTANNNYTVPVEKNNIRYQDSNWSLLNQTSYGGQNLMAEFIGGDKQFDDYNYNNEGNYDNNYGYDDYYGNEYSNESNYTFYDKEIKKDVSVNAISNKINANMNDELLYGSLESDYPSTNYKKSSKRTNNNLKSPKINNYDDSLFVDTEYGDETVYKDIPYRKNYKSDSHDNKTVAIDMSELGYDNYYAEEIDEDHSVYRAIDTESRYHVRKGVYDDKLMPTQDIVFDDIYVVRNQLFDEEEKLFTFNDVISLAICVAFAIIMAFLIIRYVGQVTVVKGHSMEYNFHNKEVILLDKLSYKIKDPERYDVVVFPVKKDKGYEYYIKRIIGLPGEKVYVDIQQSQIYIDEKRLNTDVFGWEPMVGDEYSVTHNNVTLGTDEYYCMGDNRNNSQDSRASSVGSINRDDFLGKAIFKVSPLESFGLIDHYYNHEIRSGRKPAYDFYATDDN
ncbi:MAG: signal peptidase I [Lachnospiraceae bacterium]|nr:signal peptidase I [Lachnospiraceae bacterium]